MIRDYLRRNVSLANVHARIGESIWNSILLSVKTLNKPNFRKKIKSAILKE